MYYPKDAEIRTQLRGTTEQLREYPAAREQLGNMDSPKRGTFAKSELKPILTANATE